MNASRVAEFVVESYFREAVLEEAGQPFDNW